jgi:hypothetical protein
MVAVLAGLACAGCVERRFVIESNVPNAQVYINDKPIGAAPAHTPFEYYGHYDITIVEPGYEILYQRVNVRPPWYDFPPIDFLAEVVYPFHIHDTRRYYFELCPAVKPRPEDLTNAADDLRTRGQNLPTPKHPAPPKPQSAPQPVPTAPVLPPGTIIPPAGPGIPGGPGIPPQGIVPSVQPPG